MTKLFKWLLGLLLFFTLLVVGAVILIPLLIDPNDYKDDIIAHVKEHTGRDLVLEERLELSVFPTLAIQLGGASLSNAQGFGERPFAEVERLSLRVGLIPMLSNRVEVDQVLLRGLVLNLAKDADGKTNWEDLGGKGPSKTNNETSRKDKTDDATQMDVAIEGIRIENARVAWQDKQAGQHFMLSGLRLETGPIKPGVKTDVSLGLKLNQQRPDREFELSLDLGLTADHGFKQIKVEDLIAKLAAGGEGLPSRGVDLDLGIAELMLDQKSDRLTIQKIELAGAGLELSADLAIAGLGDRPQLSGTLALAESNLKDAMNLLTGSAPMTTDPDVLTKVAGRLTLKPSGTGLRIEPLNLTLDDSRVSGWFDVPDPRGPKLRFDLTLDEINVDRYLPPKAEIGAGQPAEQAATQRAKNDDPLAALRTLDVEGAFRIGKLIINKLHAQDIVIALKADNGILTTSPTAKLYQGGLKGKITVNAQNKTPRIQIEQALTGIEISGLLGDLAEFDRLTGKGEVHIDLSMRGLTPEQIKPSLNGSTRFTFKDGVIRGTNIVGTICRFAGQDLGNLMTSDAAGVGAAMADGETPFSDLSASTKIIAGVVGNDDLSLKSPFLRIAGKGKIDLPKEALDYRLTAKLVTACSGQGGKGSDELVGVPLPIYARGTFSDPDIKPDWRKMLEELAKSKATDEGKRLLKDKLKEVIPGGLKLPLGRSDASKSDEKADPSEAVKGLLKGFGL